jgi:hypothetical protein
MTLALLQAACNELTIESTIDATTRSTAPTTSYEGATAAEAATTTITLRYPALSRYASLAWRHGPACSRRDRSDGTLARLQAACNELKIVPTTDASKVLASVLLAVFKRLTAVCFHRCSPRPVGTFTTGKNGTTLTRLHSVRIPGCQPMSLVVRAWAFGGASEASASTSSALYSP